MADTKISALTTYAAPKPDDIIPIVDVANTTTKGITFQNIHNPSNLVNFSTAAQGAGFSTDTYLTGSNLTLPAGSPDVGTMYRCVFYVSKTAGGSATPIIQLRTGTLGTTGDTSRCSFTFSAGTAATDTGRFEVVALFRTVGSSTSAVLQGTCALVSQPTTGFSSLLKNVMTTSSGFDSTTGNSVIGVSVNGGASASWTVQLVRAELIL